MASSSLSRVIPSSGGIGLDSPAQSPIFSSPFALPQEGAVTKSKPSMILEGSLAGRQCLVTGGTSGIGMCLFFGPTSKRILLVVSLMIFALGYEIAKRFLQEGAASVISISRDRSKIAAAARRMTVDLNRQDLPFHFLLGDIASPSFLKEKIIENRRLVGILPSCSALTLH